MAEREEELKSFLMRVKEERKEASLKLNIQKNEDHGMQSDHFTANRWGGGVEIVIDFLFLGSKSLWIMTATMKLKCIGPWEKNAQINTSKDIKLL